MYIYIWGKYKWGIYIPCLQINTQQYFLFFSFFFKCILLQKVTKNVFYKYFYTRTFRGTTNEASALTAHAIRLTRQPLDESSSAYLCYDRVMRVTEEHI